MFLAKQLLEFGFVFWKGEGAVSFRVGLVVVLTFSVAGVVGLGPLLVGLNGLSFVGVV